MDRREFLKFATAGTASLPLLTIGCAGSFPSEKWQRQKTVFTPGKDDKSEVIAIDEKVRTAYDIPYLQIDIIGTNVKEEKEVKLEQSIRDDFTFLGWEFGRKMEVEYRRGHPKINETKNYSSKIISKSKDGRVLYEVQQIKKVLLDNIMVIQDSDYATVLFDPAKRTKTVFRYVDGLTYIRSLLSDQGNLLYLGLPRDIPFPPPPGAKGKKVRYLSNWYETNKENYIYEDYFQLSESGGVYLIDLINNMRVIYNEYGDTASDSRFSKDGNVFHANHKLYNVSTKEVRDVSRRSHLSSYAQDFEMSPDGNYIVHGIGMFSASKWVEGQWGLEVYTPEGYFMLSSPTRSLFQKEIQNDGTILDSRGHVFKLIDGTYKCLKSPEGKPLTDLRVRRL